MLRRRHMGNARIDRRLHHVAERIFGMIAERGVRVHRYELGHAIASLNASKNASMSACVFSTPIDTRSSP